MYEVGYHALQNHTASRITGVTGADTYQQLLGGGSAGVTVSAAYAVALDNKNQFIYVGTNDTTPIRGASLLSRLMPTALLISIVR